jgi:hypothetical protein
MDKQEKIFAEGIRFERPGKGVPAWIKGKISIKVADFISFLEKHQSNAGWVNIDLKQSQKGTLYLELNTYKPTQTPSIPDNSPSIDPISGGNSDLIPF